MDWTVETASGFGSWAALDVSVRVIGPVAQDEGVGGRSGPSPASSDQRASRPDPNQPP